jgi:RNA polymerase sigma-70 factor (ECF subfamily)
MTAPLLTRVAAGDMDAADKFLRRHAGLVWGLARRYCRSPEDAEDAVQEIFVEVWRSAERYDAALGAETAFLTTIARRRLIDRTRRLGHRAVAELLEDPGTLPAEERSDQAVLHDEVQRAHEAMQQLRPEQRQVLEMALGHSRTLQEISSSMGIPLGTVKSHARRGLTRLRTLLGVAEGSPAGGAS